MIDQVSRDDFQRIRLRREAWVWPGLDPMSGGVPAFVGQVTTSTSLIAVGDYFLAQPTFVMGPEVEGGVGSFTPIGSTNVPVYLVGSGTTATGEYLVCKFVDNRWVAERSNVGGGTGGGIVGTIPFCFCSPIPGTLTMTSSDPGCNYQMFQSCTIQYGPTPTAFEPLNLGANTFLSTQGFPDPVAGGALFYYYLTCQYNQFVLTRVYPVSPYGSPFRDGLLYSWLLGGYGNTCDPFHLDNGSAFLGSDLSCFVTIDAA
jgi:hypothetical protein